MPNDFKEQLLSFFLSSSIGGTPDKAPFLIIDPAQFDVLRVNVYQFVTYMIETINPSIKVITLIDNKYGEVKSVLDGSTSNKNSPVKV